MHMEREMDEERAQALDAAMTAVSVRDDEATRSRLFELFLTATVAVATPEELPEGRRTVRAGEQLQFVTTRGEDDSIVLPVFTRLEALRNWTRGEAREYLSLPMAALFQMTAQDGATTIWINPGEPVSGYVAPQEIQDLARGRLPLGRTAKVAASSSVELSPLPSLPPQALLESITGPLSRHPEIDRAWGFFMQQTGLDAETVIGIGFKAGTAHETVRATMRAVVDEACAAAEANKALSFMAAREDLRTSLTEGAGLELYHAQ